MTFVPLLLLAAGSAWAAPKDDAFMEGKKDVQAVVVERVRRAPGDTQRALKAGENRLRRLHDDYRLARSTPPATLEQDMARLTSAVTAARLARSRGQAPPPDPRAEAVLSRLWDKYGADRAALVEDIQYKRDAGTSSSRTYWEALKDFDALAADTLEAAALNPPPGGDDAEKVLSLDRAELLKRLEDPARTRGRASCVKAPDEVHRPPSFDIAPFYRAAGLLPGTNPLRKFAFELPPGCRTVTQREPGARLILRAGRGRGTALVGDEEKPLVYDYLQVPPEAPYLVENRGEDPLLVEGLALRP